MVADPSDIVLKCSGIGQAFGSKRVLNDISFEIGRGQIVALVGPSGSGKSTLLRAILGTHPAAEGEMLMEGKPYREPSRDRGIVYQRYSLFSFLTVEENVALGPKLDRFTLPGRILNFLKSNSAERGRQRERRMVEARDWLEQVGLAEAARQYPDQLSGGMRQRVALAQALIMRPKLLLLDEPFGALDEATREELQLMLLRLYDENSKARAAGQQPPYTILIVTHELNEALYVSDRVLGLSQYHQEGTQGATIVYDKPAPTYRPDDPKDSGDFVHQREEMLRAVFSDEYIQHRDEYVSFWDTHTKANV